MNQYPPAYNPGWDPSTAPPQPQQVLVQAPQPQQILMQAPPQTLLGNKPCVVTCPSCEARQISRVRYEISSKTHLTALLICFLCGCCGCFLLPYFMKSFKSAIHSCGKCGCFIGTFTN